MGQRARWGSAIVVAVEIVVAVLVLVWLSGAKPDPRSSDAVEAQPVPLWVDPDLPAQPVAELQVWAAGQPEA